jgi:RHH-type proline utilization regulon transcriptional repressor/proline dehydrogenase/delta 1-pyrroline-5-carboxylate dehydrogenase
VLAKPAEQTPLDRGARRAACSTRPGLDPALCWHCCRATVQSVGSAIVGHPGIDGVAFTGGTETAWAINRQLAARNGPIIPFIAETGGLNGMFVDTTALREQVVDDVILSAVGSAGQRCSALRVLFVPQRQRRRDDRHPEGRARRAGDRRPGRSLDRCRSGDRCRGEGRVGRASRAAGARGGDRPPVDPRPRAAISSPADRRECPPPISSSARCSARSCTSYRYDPADLAKVAGRLAARGYGLTLGIHSRIERFAEEVRELVPAGNVYVNRSIIGAVVGVQPFGGEGLSGTGPKAGGPHALLRYATERAVSVNITAQGGDPALLNL